MRDAQTQGSHKQTRGVLRDMGQGLKYEIIDYCFLFLKIDKNKFIIAMLIHNKVIVDN